MPSEWLSPPDGEALDLRILGDAFFNDGADEDDGTHQIPVLSHPFYHQILYAPLFHEWANRGMAQKEEAIRRMIKDGKVLEMVWIYERPYRCNYIHYLWSVLMDCEWEEAPGFPEAWDDLIEPLRNAIYDQYRADPKPFWNKCRSVWTDNENIWQEVDKWNDLWFDQDDASLWMDDENQERLLALPKKVEVWRGDCNDGGWSFTLDQKMAEFFAKRPYNEPTGEVVRLEVPKDAIYCFIGDRGEEEVILLEEDLTEFELERYSIGAAS
jgi:hypothetical protein